ncbi:MAG: RNA methyltransferase [Candidatus Cloacimonetes bacterium]|nr:RNA methyltransferase [Candidatus Cloacimonadota bacterium]
MKYKCLTLISEKKWDNFSEEKRKKILIHFFIEIEEILANKLYHHEDIYTKMPFLLENMGRSDWKDYIFELSDPIPWKYAYNILSDIYQSLRHLLYDDIIEHKDFHFLPEINVLKKDNDKKSKILPVIIILDNLRSAFNVGAIIRTAECLNLEEIWFCGYTPKPDHPKIANTAMGTQNKIRWQFFNDTITAVRKAQNNEFKVYALETVEKAKSVYEQNFHEKIAIVLGNEALGISEEVIDFCDNCIMLPILGWKNSLNVATACSVVCFEIYRQKEFIYKEKICQNYQK